MEEILLVAWVTCSVINISELGALYNFSHACFTKENRKVAAVIDDEKFLHENEIFSLNTFQDYK